MFQNVSFLNNYQFSRPAGTVGDVYRRPEFVLTLQPLCSLRQGLALKVLGAFGFSSRLVKIEPWSLFSINGI